MTAVADNATAYPYLTGTPVQIDTRLVALMAEHAKTAARLAAAVDVLTRRDADTWVSATSVAYAEEAMPRLNNAVRAQNDEFLAILDEWNARGRWSRYWLVTNAGGHVHTSTTCSTCFPTTSFALLAERSGQDRADLVADAGEAACTVCFPDAPVDVLKRRTRLETADARAIREEREAKKAAAAEKRAAKALFTEDPDRGIKVDSWETIRTLAAARTWLTDGYTWSWEHPSYTLAMRAEVAAAVAAKECKPVEQVLAEAAKRAARRR